MKERPILFSGPMVRAILDGRKTMTRRVVKPRHDWNMDDEEWPHFQPYVYGVPEPVRVNCPYGVPGDRLWVRETWGLASPCDETCWFKGALRGRTLGEMCLEWEVRHRASYGSNQEAAHWRPSIFMPRWASRILLEVTSVRVERLQDISEEDARAEGAPADDPCDHKRYTCEEIGCSGPVLYREGFADLWKAINGAGTWEANPWVWVISFHVILFN